MYSTKQLENILLAELTRTQYDTFMETVRDSTDLSYKEIRNVRNSETFRKVFGNKQRIWIPLDIAENTEISVDKYLEFENLFKKYNNSDLDWYLIKTIESLINDYYSVTENTNILSQSVKINKARKLLLWIKGYFIDPTSTTSSNTRFVKIGSLINKLISLAKKKHSTDTEKLSQLMTNLQDILKAFNSRDTDPRLPKELYAVGRSVPDEAVFGRTIKKDKLYICISRYPADVAAMSTGQGWSSCQNLDHNETKTNIDYDNLNWHVKYDVSLGTCIAYLITESNIKRSQERQNMPKEYDKRFEGKSFIPKTSLFPLLSPKSRILIKPHYGIDEDNKGQIYLSIGTTPRVYGNINFEKILIYIVNQFLEERQHNLNGNFKLPDELYNEALQGANIVHVINGVIKSISGHNKTITQDPALTRLLQSHFELIDKIVKQYEKNNKRYPIFLINQEISNKKYIHKSLNCIAGCIVTDTIFKNASLIRFDDYSNTLQPHDIVYNVIHDMSQDEFNKKFNTTVNKKLLQDITNRYSQELYRYLNVYNTEISAFERCTFDKCNFLYIKEPYTRFDSCEFSNIRRILIKQHSVFNKCNFSNCAIDTETLDNFYRCTFNNCRIVISQKPTTSISKVPSSFNSCKFSINLHDNYFFDYNFAGLKFNNCNFEIPTKSRIDDETIKGIPVRIRFIDCVMDGEKHSIDVTEYPDKYVEVPININELSKYGDEVF